MAAAGRALRPEGVLAVDLCDLSWGRTRVDAAPQVRVTDSWVFVMVTSTPSPDRFVREMTVFVRKPDGSWRRDDERHDNVLVDTCRVPGVLAAEGVAATVTASFGAERLPPGLMAVVGRRPEHSGRSDRSGCGEDGRQGQV